MPAQRKTNQSRWLTVAGLIGVSAATLLMMAWAVLPAAVAQADPPGNNGTIKVDEVAFDDHPNNEPHVGCVFQIDFYGFDEGDLFADVSFDMQPPTGSGENLLTDEVFIGEDDNSGGGSEAGLDASETYTLDFTGFTPHPQQGFHVKLTVNADGSQGADTKFKVFWVTGCAATTTTTVPTTTTTVPTTTTTVPTTTTTVPTTTTTVPTTTTTVPTTTTTVPTTTTTVPTTTTTVPTTTTTVPTTTTTVPTTTTATGGGGGATTPPSIGPTTVDKSKSETVDPTTVRPGKLAFTGLEDVVPIGAIALMLMTSGTGLLWAGSRRRRRDGSQDED